MFSSSGLAQVDKLEKVVFQPDWFPNAQFSGFFWAKEDRLYAEKGLDVRFEAFDFGVDFMEKVSTGEANFGTAEAYILMDAVASGAPLVALGAVLAESPAGYIYLKESGIQSGEDLKGKRVGVHAYAEKLLPYFAAEAGFEAKDVQATEVQHKIEVLLEGTVDLHQGYAIDEMIRLQSITDKEVDILLFEDLGLPMYSMVIYSSRDFVNKHPEIVDDFLKATAEGWERAMQSPDVTSLIINNFYSSPEVEDSIVAQQARALKPFVFKEDRPNLSMKRAKWESMQSAYLRSGMIDEAINLDEFLYNSLSEEEVP
ncbi:MAG: ABC transporter substrate-binding protein [Verrucomicrobiota bacterium]